METLTAYQERTHKTAWEIQHHTFKRLFDVFFSAFLLFFLSPIFFLIIFIIRMCSSGNAIYVQPRLGRRGKVFKCYKFRTMHLDADERLHDILAQNPYLKKEWSKKQKLKNDPRVFSFGKWLRRTSLDELPQFWNVIKGDMSVVGPRPYMLSQHNELSHLEFKILSVRPGMTGLWQTCGRSRTTFDERIFLDATYVDTRSFYLDLILICKTIPQVLFPKNAY